jgi:hypothetical protein
VNAAAELATDELTKMRLLLEWYLGHDLRESSPPERTREPPRRWPRHS